MLNHQTHPSVFDTVSRYAQIQLVCSAGLDASATLKLATWTGANDANKKPACSDYHLISQHTGGAAVRRVDRRSTPTRARTFAVMPDCASSIWTSDHNLTCTHFYLDSDFVASIYRDMFDRDQQAGDLFEIDMCPDVAANDLLELCALECLTDADVTQLKLDGWAVVLAEKILRTQSAYADQLVETPPHVLDIRRQGDLVAFIEAHLEEDLTLEQLSGTANMNVYQLTRAFKAATGTSPYRYVLGRRVARARHLLAEGRESIADIAYQCGFSSQQHMTNTFTRVLGTTPGKYRKDRLA